LRVEIRIKDRKEGLGIEVRDLTKNYHWCQNKCVGRTTFYEARTIFEKRENKFQVEPGFVRTLKGSENGTQI
jgi:hypothetical protein